MKYPLQQIYPITDVRLSGLSHPEQVSRLVTGGARFIQIREKRDSSSALYNAVRDSLVIARRHEAVIIVNDRVDVAIAAGADGVHLGQDDIPAVKARRLMGRNAIIGISTHSVAQAIEAANLPVDYIAIGPIYETATKPDHEPAVGLSGLRTVREAVKNKAIVAIGGINSSNVGSVIENGADSAAVIGDLYLKFDSISDRFSELERSARNVKHL